MLHIIGHISIFSSICVWWLESQTGEILFKIYLIILHELQRNFFLQFPPKAFQALPLKFSVVLAIIAIFQNVPRKHCEKDGHRRLLSLPGTMDCLTMSPRCHKNRNHLHKLARSCFHEVLISGMCRSESYLILSRAFLSHRRREISVEWFGRNLRWCHPVSWKQTVYTGF